MRASDPRGRPISPAETASPFTFFGFIVVLWQALSIIQTSGSWWTQCTWTARWQGRSPGCGIARTAVMACRQKDDYVARSIRTWPDRAALTSVLTGG
jgi:hypothetical protein